MAEKSKTVNEVRLVGKLFNDADVSYGRSGKAWAKFKLVTGPWRKDEDGEKWLGKFHNVNAWEDLAEQCTNLRKGDKVQVTGFIDYQSWEDRKSGDTKYMTVIIANTVEELEDERDGEDDRGKSSRGSTRKRQEDSRDSARAGRMRGSDGRGSRDARESDRKSPRSSRRDERESEEITDDDIPF